MRACDWFWPRSRLAARLCRCRPPCLPSARSRRSQASRWPCSRLRGKRHRAFDQESRLSPRLRPDSHGQLQLQAFVSPTCCQRQTRGATSNSLVLSSRFPKASSAGCALNSRPNNCSIRPQSCRKGFCLRGMADSRLSRGNRIPWSAPENGGSSMSVCAGRTAAPTLTVSTTRPGCWSVVSVPPATSVLPVWNRRSAACPRSLRRPARSLIG